MVLIPNNVFLKQYMAALPHERIRLSSEVILPHEEALIEQRIQLLEGKMGEIATERAFIAEQSGDNWHDGAFRESDREVLAVDADRKKLKDRLHGTVVDYPGGREEYVTLGSRVSIDNAGRNSMLDIVGYSALHEKVGREAIPASLEAPIVQQIIGKRVGEIVLLSVSGRNRQIKIKSIDQTALKSEDINSGDMR